MKPTVKAQGIDDALTDMFGIDRKGSIERNECVFCKAPLANFRNAISAREASISGQCQACQDSVFGYDEPDWLPPEPVRTWYTPTDRDYVIEQQPMRSGQGEAQSRRYHLHVGKSGKRWLLADQDNAAANIYVEGGPNSDGFGGATLTFPLVDGGEVVLKGPWHSSSIALFDDTGVDVRDKHYTFVVVARGRESGQHYESILTDVLYKDSEPVLGNFHRGDYIAREWAQRLSETVYLHSQSEGGSRCGPVKPDAVFYWEKG